MIPRIFISVPNEASLTPGGLEIKHAVMALLRSRGFEAESFGESGVAADLGWTFDNASKLTKQCRGAVILALARHRLELNDGPTVLMASEFAHCEGSIAKAGGTPTFVMSEAGIAERGIVHKGSGWLVHDIPAAAGRDWFVNGGVGKRLEQWLEQLKARPELFFGYCSQAQSTANAIHLFLRESLDVRVKNWAFDFTPGRSILGEVTDAASLCQGGIFLFTKDDPLQEKPGQASPRDNVLLEAGYFLAAKGKHRVLVIKEAGAKMPADLGGDIYLSLADRNDTAPIESKLRQFVEAALSPDMASRP